MWYSFNFNRINCENYIHQWSALQIIQITWLYRDFLKVQLSKNVAMSSLHPPFNRTEFHSFWQGDETMILIPSPYFNQIPLNSFGILVSMNRIFITNNKLREHNNQTHLLVWCEWSPIATTSLWLNDMYCSSYWCFPLFFLSFHFKIPYVHGCI